MQRMKLWMMPVIQAGSEAWAAHAVSCLQVGAFKADTSFTISATVSRPSGRKASNLESLNRNAITI